MASEAAGSPPRPTLLAHQHQWWKLSELKSKVHEYDDQRADLVEVVEMIDHFLAKRIATQRELRSTLTSLKEEISKTQDSSSGPRRRLTARRRFEAEETARSKEQVSAESKSISELSRSLSDLTTHIQLLKDNAKISSTHNQAGAQRSKLLLFQTLNLLFDPAKEEDARAKEAKAEAKAVREVLNSKQKDWMKIRDKLNACKKRRSEAEDRRLISLRRTKILSRVLTRNNPMIPPDLCTILGTECLADAQKVLKGHNDWQALEKKRAVTLSSYAYNTNQISEAREKRRRVQDTLANLARAKQALASNITQLSKEISQNPIPTPATPPPPDPIPDPDRKPSPREHSNPSREKKKGGEEPPSGVWNFFLGRRGEDRGEGRGESTGWFGGGAGLAQYVGKWLHLANSTQSAEPKPFSVRCKLVLPRRSSDTKLTDSIRKEKRPTTPPPSRRTLKPPKMEGLLRISRGALEFTPRDPRGKSTHLDLAKIVGVDIERNKTPPPSHPPPSRFDRENSTRWKYDPFLNPPPIPENDGKWNEGGEYVLRVEMEMGGKLSFEGGNDLLTAHRVLMAAISSRSYQKIQPQKSHALDTKSAVQDPNNENSRKDGLSGAAIEIEGESGIAKEDEMRLLVCAMPSLYQLYTWRRVYTLTKDGASLEAVRRLVQSFRQILMLVMESTHQVFGAFITHTTLETRTGKKAAFFSPSLKPGALVGTNTAPTLFFGNGECFVFSIGGGKVERSVKVYRWSGKNDMHVCITNSIITIGGGGNGPAIKLGIHLKEGETNACDTYASPSLVSQVSEKGEEGDSRKRVEDGGPKEFICYDIEIWAAF